MEDLLHLSEGNQPSVLLGFYIGVKEFKSLLKDRCHFLDFALVKTLEQIGLKLNLLLLLFLSLLFVSFEEHLNSVNTVRDEVLPGDLAIWIFVSKGK